MKGNGSQVRGSSIDTSEMNMPQSMMVLNEADELRRRRNTVLLDKCNNNDDLLGNLEIDERLHSGTLVYKS